MLCQEALDHPRPEAPNLPLLLVAAAALIDKDDRILIAQRPEGKPMAGLWEFPGGKLRPQETPEYALMRELGEELGIETRPCCFTPAGFSSHAYETFHLLMPLFSCRSWSGTVQAKVHQDLKWVRLSDLSDYPMPEADKPLVSQLRDLLL